MNRRTLLRPAFLWLLSTALFAQGQFSATVLDLQTHGLAIVLKTPGGKTWLVDAGLRPTAEYYAARDTISPFLKAAGVRALDGVLISHPHGDHYGGLPLLLDQYRVGQLVDAGYEEIGGSELETYRELRKRYVAGGGSSIIVRQGARLSMDPELDSEILWPPESLHRPNPATKDDALYNANSIVLRVRHGANVFLFPGDCHGISGLADRLGREKVKCDVLVAPHHGLNSTPAMAAVTNPKIVLVSCLKEYSGPSPFPAKLTAEAFASVGATVYVTHSHGSITVVSDGKSLQASTTRTP